MNTVRRAKQTDIPAIMLLLEQVNGVHHNGRSDLFKERSTKYTKEELADIIKNDKTPVFVCVDDDDNVLGHGFCVFEHSAGNNLVEHDTLYIDDICVNEDARRQGVGKSLYLHIKDFAKESGCYNLTLNVWSCNPNAMRFYEKMGLYPYKVGMEEVL